MPRRVLRGWDRDALRELRLSRGLSRIDVARLSHISLATIRHWENGQRFPQIDALRRVLKILTADAHDVIKIPESDRYPGDLRVLQCLTQPELAKKAEITTSSLREIERGIKNLSLNDAEKISRVLDVSVEEYRTAFERCRNRPPGTPS